MRTAMEVETWDCGSRGWSLIERCKNIAGESNATNKKKDKDITNFKLKHPSHPARCCLAYKTDPSEEANKDMNHKNMIKP